MKYRQPYPLWLAASLLVMAGCRFPVEHAEPPVTRAPTTTTDRVSLTPANPHRHAEAALLQLADFPETFPNPEKTSAPTPTLHQTWESESSTSLPFRADDLKVSLKDVVEKYNLPSAGAAVILDGKLALMATSGHRAVAVSALVEMSDKWHLGSCTKAMTATLVALEIEAGTWKWNQTLAELFPDYEIHPDLQSATLEQLLAHTSGVGNVVHPMVWQATWNTDSPAATRREALAKYVLKSTPAVAPGTKTIYSNFGYVVAGHALERLHAKSWEEITKEKLFKPLGMDSAGFGPPIGDGENPTSPAHPQGHRWIEKEKKWESVPPTFPTADNPEPIGPAGRVHCTLADWSKFIAFHLAAQQGKSTLLNGETAAHLATPLLENGMGLGWGVATRAWASGPVLSHAGSNTLWYCVVWASPADGFAVLLTTNCAGKNASKALDEIAGFVISNANPRTRTTKHKQMEVPDNARSDNAPSADNDAD